MFQHHTKKPLQSQSCAGVFPLWKDRGETLAELLIRFRALHNLDAVTKLTYAGRLDPMAEGLVVILAGEARFQKDAMLGLPKVYEVEVLLGIATDTLDPLGLITTSSDKVVDVEKVRNVVDKMQTITTLPYPHYSSVPVDGKPLFVHARAGNIVEVPNKKVQIFQAELLNMHTISLAVLAQQIIEDIQKVRGDFRQQEIIEKWNKLMSENDREVTLVTIRINASSGTYMRSLAEWLGNELGVPAIAYKIIRTKLGEYTI